MYLILSLDGQDELFLDEVKSAQGHRTDRAAPRQARRWPRGPGCQELAPLGRRLRPAVAAGPMSEEDHQLHSSPAAAGIAEEFQLVR